MAQKRHAAGRDTTTVVAIVIAGLALMACRESSVPARVGPERSGRGEVHDLVDRAEVVREVSRLSPPLREAFETEAGKREFERALADKKLLVLEARRQGLADDPEIARQVRELEERLVVRKLLEEREKRAPLTEQDARAWFDTNKEQLRQPERVRVRRLLASTGGSRTKEAQALARGRAEKLRQRLSKGEPAEKVAADGDGAERTRGGDLGYLAQGDPVDKAVLAAAAKLMTRGEISPVVETADGYAVLVLLDRKEARIPTFEEARADVEARVAPQRKRKVFDDLIQEVRAREGGTGQAVGTR